MLVPIIGVMVDCGKAEQFKGRVDRVPAFVDHRTGGQVYRTEIPEELAEHLHRQIIDAGGW